MEILKQEDKLEERQTNTDPMMASSSTQAPSKKLHLVSSSPSIFPSSSLISSLPHEIPLICYVNGVKNWSATVDGKYQLEAFIVDFKDEFAKEKKKSKKEVQDHYVCYNVIKNWLNTTCKLRLTKVDGVVTDTKVRELLRLTPIFVSNDIRPDVVMYKGEIPVLVIEVHSSPYENSLRKLSLVLVEQLRLLKNADEGINEVCGFCFPKSSEASCVCQMTVSWDVASFLFEVDYSGLAARDVEKKVQEVYRKQSSIFSNVTPVQRRLSIPLCEESIDSFKKALKIDESVLVYQMYSKSALLLCDGSKVYKHIINDSERSTIFLLFASYGQHCGRFLLPIDVLDIFPSTSFFVYHYMSPPLSREKARTCLGTFVQSVIEALQELHKVTRRAHLDVRLDNICFSKEYEAVLIDLDRCRPLGDNVSSLNYVASVMYEVPPLEARNWTCQMLDWKQLAYMISYLYETEDIESYHQMRIAAGLEDDEFVQELLKGDYSEELFKTSIVNRSDSMKLDEVLKNRQPGST